MLTGQQSLGETSTGGGFLKSRTFQVPHTYYQTRMCMTTKTAAILSCFHHLLLQRSHSCHIQAGGQNIMAAVFLCRDSQGTTCISHMLSCHCHPVTDPLSGVASKSPSSPPPLPWVIPFDQIECPPCFLSSPFSCMTPKPNLSPAS